MSPGLLLGPRTHPDPDGQDMVTGVNGEETGGAGQLSAVYERIQNLFAGGLVTVIGSGASCGYGLPSMSQLAVGISDALPGLLAQVADPGDLTALQQVSDALTAGESLEKALSADRSEEVQRLIRATVGRLVQSAEEEAIRRLIFDPTQAVYIRLFELILKVNRTADVITTNYDRLIEVSAALGNQRVDTMFYGHTLGRLDKTRAELEMYEGQQALPGGSRQRRVPSLAPRIRLAKPHGSLDWKEIDGTVFRAEIVGAAPHIIAPSAHKFREGYDVGFQEHVTRSSEAIARAAGFLFIGFGFNDDHLQTHLIARLRQTPSVVLAQSLTDSAKSFLQQSPQMIAVEASPGEGGATIHFNGTSIDVELPLWELDALLTHVLNRPRTTS